MANVFLAWQNRIDSATLSGGNWNAGLPLNNLKSPVIQKVARSANALTGSTQFLVDLGSAKPIGVMALLAHSISQAGRVRLTGSDSTSSLTNLVSFESDLRDTAEAGSSRPWTQSAGATVTLVAGGPDGQSASKLGAAFPGYQTKTATQTFSASNGAEIAVYLYVKAAECGLLNVSVLTKAGATPNATFDVFTGSVVENNSSAGVSFTSVAVELVEDWYRCAVNLNIGSGGTTPSITFTLRSQPTTAPDSLSLDFTTEGFRVEEPNFIATSTGDGLLVSSVTVLASSTALYDSGWMYVYPPDTLSMAQRNWEDDNFWTGELSSGDLVGLQSPFVHVLTNEQFLRYWKIEISDTTNAAGYVDIGRCMLARGWRPGVNYSYGAAINYFDPSPSVTSLSGTMYFDERPKGRQFRFEIDAMTSEEAYGYALDMQRLAGITNEVLLVPDTDDAGNIPLRAFAGRLTALNGIGVPDPSRYTCTFELKEII